MFSSVHFGSIWSTLILFGPFWSTLILFCTLQSYSVHIGPFRSLWSTEVLFGPFGLFFLLWFYSIHIGPVWSILSTLILICPFILIQSTSFLFDTLRSYLVQFGSPCSNSVLLCSFNPLRFIWSNSVHLCALT